MYNLLSKLLQFNVQAKDGEMGKVKDIYFDEDTNIRYAIVDTRKWLPERKVILPPSSFIAINEEDENLEVAYDKEMIRKSPPVPEETILTMEEENQLIHYFGWLNQWPTNSRLEKTSQAQGNSQLDAANQRMHSWLDILGSRVHASNGKLGRLRDLLFDENWQVNYLVVQLNYEEEKYAVFSVQKIVSVDWYDGDFYLNETTAAAEKAKSYRTKQDLVKSFF